MSVSVSREPATDWNQPSVSPRAQIGVYCAVLILVAAAETTRWIVSPESPLAGWLCGPQADWLPYLVWLCCAPLFWRVRTRRAATLAAGPPRLSELHRAWLCAILVAIAAFVSGWCVGSTMHGLPPAYHDEYSYLFQARTFLAGRLWFPGFEPMPGLFDQMHVLNEGRFASRYFPGAGLWMAPFVLAGNPWLGHWTANALAAFFLFWAGRETGGNLVGLVAGLLFAASPGIALFSNLLLAHHPTLVGLMLFLWAFLRMKRTGSIPCAAMAGIGLAFAMLCRPMTAFGIGLPFGAYFSWWLLTGDGIGPVAERKPASARIKTAIALGGPILLGLIAIGGYNNAVTGDWRTTPYQLYTDVYTPRHVYGFNNVVRGEQRLGPKVLENYDRWAENLDGSLAARNIWRRTISSLRWVLGIVPLLAAALVLLPGRGYRNGSVWLVTAAIVCLHLVHVPYWFEGIMGWHYVFESAPFWLLLFAVATERLVGGWWRAGKYGMTGWWAGLIGIAVAINLVTVTPLWPGRLQAGIVEVGFSRARYARFQQEVDQVVRRPAVVFVEADPADRHIDFVVNHPALDAEVLFARYRPGQTDLAEARALFPEREAWLYRAATGEWIALRRQGAAHDEDQ